MELKKTGENSFSIEGLTIGKLMAIAHALGESKENKTLGVVGQDVKTFLDNAIKTEIGT